MQLPRFTKGQPARAADLNTLSDAIRRVRVLPSAGVRVTETTNGVLLATRPGRGGSQRIEHPFQLTAVRQNNANKIRVRYGTIQGAAPSGMSLGDDPPYLLTPSGSSGVVYAVVTFNRSEASTPITSRSLGVAGELPEDDIDKTHNEIGSWTTNDAGRLVIAQSVTTSLWVDPFGFVFLWGPA